MISGLGITDLGGLENVESFENELSIEDNPYLVTLQNLGANLAESYRTSIRNIKVTNNPQLGDLEGFTYIESVEGQ